MKGNISILDGILRLFGGIVLGAIAGVLSYWIGAWAMLFVPFIIALLATAMAGDCPLYRMLGISTVGPKKDSADKAAEQAEASTPDYRVAA